MILIEALIHNDEDDVASFPVIPSPIGRFKYFSSSEKLIPPSAVSRKVS